MDGLLEPLDNLLIQYGETKTLQNTEILMLSYRTLVEKIVLRRDQFISNKYPPLEPGTSQRLVKNVLFEKTGTLKFHGLKQDIYQSRYNRKDAQEYRMTVFRELKKKIPSELTNYKTSGVNENGVHWFDYITAQGGS